MFKITQLQNQGLNPVLSDSEVCGPLLRVSRVQEGIEYLTFVLLPVSAPPPPLPEGKQYFALKHHEQNKKINKIKHHGFRFPHF